MMLADVLIMCKKIGIVPFLKKIPNPKWETSSYPLQIPTQTIIHRGIQPEGKQGMVLKQNFT